MAGLTRPMLRMQPIPAWSVPSQHLCRRCWRALVTAQAAPLGRRWKHLSTIRKEEEGAQAWAERAEKIKAGKVQNTWDMLEERGFVKNVAGNRDTLREMMRVRRMGAYVGVDPTAASLHVGHLVAFMPIFWLYLHGYVAVTLIGGSTAKIGDPTDRLTSREGIPRTHMTNNIMKIHYQLKKLWTNVEEQGRRFNYPKEWASRRAIVNNNVWWNKLPMFEVLKRLGSGMRIGPMLSRDSVKQRLEKGEGMSFAEFAYPLMQAWDWWRLNQSLGIQMQIGGSDQYGNILTGIESVKLLRDTEPAPHKQSPRDPEGLDEPIGFTVPLLTDSSGAKFGKSAGNAIWLDPYMTNAFDLYGYFVRRPDEDVEKLLKMFTFLPMDMIQSVMKEHAADPRQRVAHHLLAFEVSTLIHGNDVAQTVQAQHRALYSKDKGGSPAEATAAGHTLETGTEWMSDYLVPDGQPTTPNNAPRIDMQLPESLIMGKSIARVLYAAGLAKSTSEGHRLATQQCAYVGGSPGQAAAENKGMNLHQLEFTPVKIWIKEHTTRFLIDGKYLILRRGKHNIRFIEMVSDDEWAASNRRYLGEPKTGEHRMKFLDEDKKPRLATQPLSRLNQRDMKRREGAIKFSMRRGPTGTDQSDERSLRRSLAQDIRNGR